MENAFWALLDDDGEVVRFSKTAPEGELGEPGEGGGYWRPLVWRADIDDLLDRRWSRIIKLEDALREAKVPLVQISQKAVIFDVVRGRAREALVAILKLEREAKRIKT